MAEGEQDGDQDEDDADQGERKRRKKKLKNPKKRKAANIDAPHIIKAVEVTTLLSARGGLLRWPVAASSYL